MPGYHSDAARAKRPGGFTLIELLVTIGLIAVLVGILLPALAAARAAGRGTVTVSNLQQLGVTFEQYLQAYHETYPYASPGSSFVVSPPDEGDLDIVTPEYWDLDAYWTALMHDIAPWRTHFETWVGPGAEVEEGAPWRRPSGQSGIPSYHLSHTFFARPELWGNAPQNSDEMLRPVYSKDVLYPASKVMLWDWELTQLHASPHADRDLRAMAFADGHVAVRRLSEAAAPPVIPFKPDTKPVQDTPDGARGRDY